MVVHLSRFTRVVDGPYIMSYMISREKLKQGKGINWAKDTTKICLRDKETYNEANVQLETNINSDTHERRQEISLI